MTIDFKLPTLIFFLCFPLLSLCSQVAIVIDDIGYRKTDKIALTLPGNITYSVLPHTPYGYELASSAHLNNKDVLLHIPMESEVGKKLGPASLTSEMSEQDIHLTLEKAFLEIPFAIGINNHMGSYLTQLYAPMAATMKYLKTNNRIFLDSKTTPFSKGEEVAKLFGVPSLHRHVFLDNKLNKAYISKQFQQLMSIAKQQGKAIGIAHPHPKTIAILKELIPLLSERDIELVKLSQILTSNELAINAQLTTE